jgi:hypothetical protein
MTLVGFVTVLTVGIGGCDSTEVKLDPGTPTEAAPKTELPKEKEKGGGSGSSGNSKQYPGRNT